MEPGTGSAGDRQKFFYRLTAVDDKNQKRPQLATNSGVPGETTTPDDNRGVPNTQEETTKQVRSRLPGGQNYRSNITGPEWEERELQPFRCSNF